MRRVCAGLCLLATLGHVATAGELPAATSPRITGSPLMRVWRTEEFGASAINWRAVVHPRTGFVYVANSAGVLEFDGVRWRLIPMPRGVAARVVLVGPDDRVWAAGQGTVAMLEPINPVGNESSAELIARDVTPRLPPRILAAATEIPDADTGEENDIPASGIATLTGVVPTLLAAPDGVYLRLRHHLVRFGPQDRVDTWDITESASRLWWSDGAAHWLGNDGRVYRLADDRVEPTAIGGRPRVFATAPQPDGSWIWLTQSGPWRVRGDIATPLGSETTRRFFAAELPFGAIALPDGGFAYATTRHGLVLLDRAGEITEIIDRSRGLPTDRINGVTRDAEGGLWLMLHTGIVRIQRESALTAHGLAQGLRGSPRVASLSGDRLYLAHSEGLAWREPATGRFESVQGFAGGINQVEAADGGEILATGAGFFAIPAGSNRAVLCSDTTTRYGLSLGRSEPGTAYVSTQPHLALARRNPPGYPKPWSIAFRFTNLPTGANGFVDDGTGFVWVASRSDRLIRRLDLRGGARADAPVQTFGPKDGLPAMTAADKVRFVHTGGALFVVSRLGAWRWAAEGARFESAPRLERDGAGPDAVGASPEAGWLYFSRPTPLLRRISVQPGGAIAIDDLPLPEMGSLVINSMLPQIAQHTLWIAGQGQLVSVDLNWRPTFPAPPLSAVLRRVTNSAGATLWSAPVFVAPAASSTLTLAPAQRSVRIEFTAPSFAADLQGRSPLQFRSRATGVDATWTAWSDEPHRDLTNLPDGSITFEVEARDASGRTSPTTRLGFEVLPPWWRTTAARVGWGALGAALISGLVWSRTRALRRRKEQLEKIVAARTAELERLRQIDRDESAAAKLAEEKTRLEMLRYQLNPHFLYNALNSIRALVFTKPPAAGDMVSQLAALCRVTLTRNEDFAPVSEEFAMLRLYLDMEKTRLDELLAVEIQLEPAAAERPIPPFLLLPLVENALKHGRRDPSDTLRLRLTARLDNRATLILEVANTGAWLAPEETTAPSTGIGLENLRQRLQRYYPQAHRLTTSAADGWVTVTVQLNAPTENA